MSKKTTITVSFGPSARSLIVPATKKAGEEFSNGLRMAGAWLMAQSLKIVPVDTGYLRSTWYVRRAGQGWKTVISVGFTAKYAIFVHEDLSKAHGAAYNVKHAADIAAGRDHARGPNQRAKYLEYPARVYSDAILNIVTSNIHP